jgi:hypothetical protein
MPIACALAICLHLINVSSASPAVITASQHELTTTFESIGVPIQWTDNPRALLLIVRDEEPGTLHASSQPVLGAAIHAAQGAPVAYVFYRRAAEQADRYQVAAAVVVAAAMAHEIGHLVLPETAHTDRGLMRSCWEYEEFLQAARGDLRFSPQQAASIRARLLR